MSNRFDTAPASVCILRLSAIGDTCHVLPVVRTLQRAWPDTRFTWIIGRVEAKLLGHIPDIEFIVVDKKSLRGLVSPAARDDARPPLRRAHAHAGRAAREPAVDAGAGDDQARLRSRARARAAVAVHHQSHPARRAAARHGRAVRLRREIPRLREAAALGHSDSAGRARLRAARDSRTTRRRSSSVPAPAIGCATGGPSTTRRSPTTRSARSACASCCAAGRSEVEQPHGRGDRAQHERALREHHRPGHAARIPRDAGARRRDRHARLRAGAHGDGGRHCRWSACMPRPIRRAAART